jgi:hypothetical protein
MCIRDSIKILDDKYGISDELKNEIINTFKTSDCKNVSFEKIKMGDGVSLGYKLILNPSILNYSLGRALFIIFHELAHQYQFKKYGKDKMLELYEDHISLSDAAKFMHDVEIVADEFAERKLKSLERKGLVNLKDSDTRKDYHSMRTSMLEYMIRQIRDMMRKQKVTGSDKVAEFMYNLIKVEQSNSGND